VALAIAGFLVIGIGDWSGMECIEGEFHTHYGSTAIGLLTVLLVATRAPIHFRGVLFL
jgi:hypothetical protein